MNIWDWLLDDRDVFISYRIFWIVIAVLVVIAIVAVYMVTGLAFSSSSTGGANSTSGGGKIDVCITPV